MREYRFKNRDMINAQVRALYRRSPTFAKRARFYAKKWAVEHPDQKAMNHELWMRLHPEKRNEYHRRHTAKYRDLYRKRWVIYSAARRARIRGLGGRYTQEDWDRLVKQYGGRCLSCDRADLKLTADHVIPIALGGPNTIDNIQPLCGSCNSSKNARYIDYRPEAVSA